MGRTVTTLAWTGGCGEGFRMYAIVPCLGMSMPLSHGSWSDGKRDDLPAIARRKLLICLD